MTTLWGLNACGLHDHLWAARGLRVVRRGAHEFCGGGTGPFLLLEPDQCVLFETAAATRRLGGRRRAVGLRVQDRGGQGYHERVVADDDGRLATFRRHYTADVRAADDVIVTRDPAIARAWDGSRALRAARRSVRLACGLHGYRAATCEGRLFDTADAHRARDCLAALLEQWRDTPPPWSCVKALRPGVWLHDRATVERGCRILGPAWIGAGVNLRRDDLVVGPCIVEDRSAIAAPLPPAVGAARRTFRDRAVGAAAAGIRRRRGQRAFDIAFSLVALLLTAPLYPLIMLAIWLEDGRPVIFSHTRQTLGGRNFPCFKFRTMSRDAEALKARYAGRNVCDGPQFHIEDDPRLLRVGRLLRRFHLDELPQFINVVAGHMSVTGPRPSPDEENQICPAWREARLSVKPGVTGLWQVARTRAPNTDFQEWIRLDLDYVRRQSWTLDAQIIGRTIEDIARRTRRAA